MARAVRIIFVLVPFLVTLAVLAGLLLAWLGNLNSNPVVVHFAWLRINTASLRASGVVDADWFSVGLWGWCKGSAGSSKPAFCSKPKGFFFFDPVAVLGLQVPVNALLGDTAQAYLDAFGVYRDLARYTFIGYIVAISLTALVIPVSIFAFGRRLGSVFTGLVGGAAFLFTISASAAATVIFASQAAFVDALWKDELSISASLGVPALAATWWAVAGSLLAFALWAFTSCCCSGERGEREREREGREHGEKAGPDAFKPEATYGRAASPPALQINTAGHGRDVEAGFAPYRL